jgi:hypothetical protein
MTSEVIDRPRLMSDSPDQPNDPAFEGDEQMTDVKQVAHRYIEPPPRDACRELDG